MVRGVSGSVLNWEHMIAETRESLGVIAFQSAYREERFGILGFSLLHDIDNFFVNFSSIA